MADYVYLPDGTPFTASSLNSRFTSLVDKVNNVEAKDVRLYGLNTAHMPSFIGTADGAMTSFTTMSDADVVASPPIVNTAEWDNEAGAGYRFHFDPAITFGRDETADITAILVFANVEVVRFYIPDITVFGQPTYIKETPTIPGISLNEHEWDASVQLELQDSGGTTRRLFRTERQLSPRVTIGRRYSPLRDLPGGDSVATTVVTQFDHKTYQDIAIRTVITKDDLTLGGLSNLSKITFAFNSYSHSSDLADEGMFAMPVRQRFHVSRANITAIPLLAKVNT